MSPWIKSKAREVSLTNVTAAQRKKKQHTSLYLATWHYPGIKTASRDLHTQTDQHKLRTQRDNEKTHSLTHHLRVGAVMEFHGLLLNISNSGISTQGQRDEKDPWGAHTRTPTNTYARTHTSKQSSKKTRTYVYYSTLQKQQMCARWVPTP